MIDERFVLLGVVLHAAGSSSYLWATLTGRARPNRVSWFLWAAIPFIALSAQLDAGVRWAAVLVFMTGFSPLLIFLASFAHPAQAWKMTRLDITCGFLAVTGIALWQITGSGSAAIALSIAADGLAGAPTVVKAYRHPETENWHVFALTSVNAVITLLTLKKWEFASYGFTVYILILCCLLVFLIALRPKIRAVGRQDPAATS